MRPIFNEKIIKKWNLWVREQYTEPTCDWKLIEKLNFSAKNKKRQKRKHAFGKCTNAP